MKRLLLIGDPNSLYVQNYAQHIRAHFGGELVMDLFATQLPGRARNNMPYSNIYGMQNLSKIYIKYQKFFRPLILNKFLKKKRGWYDVVHVLYCIQDLMLMRHTLRSASPHIVLTVFGSDFYRLSEWRRRWFGPVYRSADFVTSNNSRALEEIGVVYALTPKQLRMCRFGFNALDTLNTFKEIPRHASRAKLQLPEDKVVICIGYNYDPIQQHLAILKSIESEPSLKANQENLFFLIPMTYGTDALYKEQLTEALGRFPFQYATIEHFLSEEENAHLRKAPDIMIQLQKSDSLSASTQEHMFAGNVVITGSWLPYDDMREAGIYFLTVNTPEEIGKALVSCIENLPEEQRRGRNNPELIFEMSSWEANLSSWLDLYKRS